MQIDRSKARAPFGIKAPLNVPQLAQITRANKVVWLSSTICRQHDPLQRMLTVHLHLLCCEAKAVEATSLPLLRDL